MKWSLESVDAEAMITWCNALRDDNPIHVDPNAAAALGFGVKTVNPGPINLSYLMNMVLEDKPGKTIRSFDATLTGNVFSGDSVTGEGAWSSSRPDSFEAQLIADPGSRTVLTAEIVVDGEGS